MNCLFHKTETQFTLGGGSKTGGPAPLPKPYMGTTWWVEAPNECNSFKRRGPCQTELSLKVCCHGYL